MKPTQALQELGQSIWLDNISRTMLDQGQLQRYLEDYSVTGLTSNPTIFDNAISSGAYDDAIADARGAKTSSEDVFFELAIADLRRAAELLAPTHQRSDGVDGWVSLEVSPLLAYDASKTVEAAVTLNARAAAKNLFVKIPGTSEGLVAIEECVARGVAINVTLLFDAAQYEAAARAYLRGVERRVHAGLNPSVGCVASVFISRWDAAVANDVPAELKNQLGLAVGAEVYRAYQEVLNSATMRRLMNYGARPQRLLWASTKTKDPTASDTLYVEGLATPLTINTMPDSTLEAFYEHGVVRAAWGSDHDPERALDRFERAGVERQALAARLQREGADAFTKSWKELLGRIDTQRSSARGAT